MNNRNHSLLARIRELSFAVVELTMYLDTHPDDCEMRAELCRRQQQLAQYKEEYSKYAALKPCGCGERWSWIDDPWPWEYAAN